MSSSNKTLNILMVEDDRVMSSVIQEMLAHTDLDFTVTTTDTGQGAIDQYNKQFFDCILLDYELPDMNAKDILQEVQTEKALSSAVIILTGHCWEELATDLLSLGAIDFITKKECSPEKLKRSIVYSISRRQYLTDHINYEHSYISNPLNSASRKVGGFLNYDRLTNLPNRELFVRDIEKAISRAKRHNLLVSLLYIDIDNFKPVNDTYGHDVGEKVLIKICERLHAAIRKNDALCRIRDDEFALFLDHTSMDTDSAVVAEKIMHILAVPIIIDSHEFYFTCSIGIVNQSGKIENSETLISRAETAMVEAKNNGKNSYLYYSDNMTAKAKNRLYLESEIRKALVNDEFYMEYQPKVDLKTNAILGAEALLRWMHPIDGLISPAKFIPVAEDSDLILKVDNWVFNAVIEQISRWEEENFNVPTISINVPSREFKRGKLADKILENLKRHQVAGNKIELEVTERLLVDHCESNVRLLKQLKDLGISISVDDFGTGYSSLSYLVQFPCDVIKIDKSFVDKVPQSHDNCMIIESIVILAHKLGKKVVAEGVETEEQYQYIKSIGCDEIQGYYFSKPLSANDFYDLMLKTNHSTNKENNISTLHPRKTGKSVYL